LKAGGSDLDGIAAGLEVGRGEVPLCIGIDRERRIEVSAGDFDMCARGRLLEASLTVPGLCRK
jgi:hypothetical protein